MEASEGFDAFGRHVNPAMARFLRVASRDYHFVQADGEKLITREGDTFADWIAGFGTLSFGHRPAFAEAALRRALDSTAPRLYVESLNPFAGQLAAALVRAVGAPFETCFFANGGSEAVEAALKTAVAATGRSRILCAKNGYHGTTLGALGCMAEGLFRDPFRELLAPVFESVELGDVAALAERLGTGRFACFLLEPIQMEAGARIASDDYLKAARRLCAEQGSLLILDEIQTGLGRTGKLFAFEHAGIKPDIFTVGKALGAGLVPISATVFAQGIWERAYGSPLKSEIHNSTLGGNALASQVALAVLEHVQAPGFLAGVRARSEQLSRAIGRVCYRRKAVERVSLRGLLGGIQLRTATHPWATWGGMGMPELEPRPSVGAVLLQRLTKHNILAHVCGHDWSVVRVEPPLNIGEPACDDFAQALDESLTWLEANVIDG